MPWEPIDWSKADREKQAKEARETNKAWGEKKERERREKVAKSFESNKQSTSKGPKM